MIPLEIPGLDEFLHDYPLMAMRPSSSHDLILKGKFSFSAESAAHGLVAETFALTIVVPRAFPKALPVVTETGGRIPRSLDFHVNGNGTLCLGSPLRLLMKLSSRPDLTGFAELCLVPYLFAISIKIRTGGKMVFDELAHGIPGIFDDYGEILGLSDSQGVRSALKLLGMRKRVANKRRCPCKCGRRLGRCALNKRIAALRRIAPRRWYRQQSIGVERFVMLEAISQRNISRDFSSVTKNLILP